MRYNKEEGDATYSYTDVLTRTIDLQVFDGESYSSIVPPKVEEPKKIKEEIPEIKQMLEQKKSAVFSGFFSLIGKFSKLPIREKYVAQKNCIAIFRATNLYTSLRP